MAMPVQKPGKSKKDYCTPPALIKCVKHRLKINNFTVDLAADEHNSLGFLYFDEKMDSLIQPWANHKGWLWCNPPYSTIELWVEKAAKEARLGAQIVMLIPASVGANWWRDWVEPNAFISYLNGHLNFIPDQPKALYPKDCALLFFTPWEFIGHEIWTWKNTLDQIEANLAQSLQQTP